MIIITGSADDWNLFLASPWLCATCSCAYERCRVPAQRKAHIWSPFISAMSHKQIWTHCVPFFRFSFFFKKKAALLLAEGKCTESNLTSLHASLTSQAITMWFERYLLAASGADVFLGELLRTAHPYDNIVQY